MKKLVFLVLAFPLWTVAQIPMDSLQYHYHGNQLIKVEDLGEDLYGFRDDAVVVADTLNDYRYDANGNLISDTNKGISNISYNHLNLPVLITFDAPEGHTRNISYTYDATGTKLEKRVTDLIHTEAGPEGTITTTQYSGKLVYEQTENIGIDVPASMGMRLKYIQHAEGYAVPNEAGGFDYVYQYKDQVENVRLWYADLNKDGEINPNTEILREQNYYPFGMFHSGYNHALSGMRNNIATYQGQEYTEDFGVNVHEWKYRFSDPSIGRFWSIDPLAEQYSYQSPYNFSENRVIDAFELEGLEKVSIHTRSFAPFKTFGGPYKGDGKNRKFGLHSKASSRISGSVGIDASSSGIRSSLFNMSVQGSESHNVITGNKTYSEAALEVNLSSSTSKKGRRSAGLDFHLKGNNDLVTGSPNINTKGDIGITHKDLGEEGSIISFSGKIFGDNFPANETFITDQNGVGIFLGVSGAEGNPFFSLFGDNNDRDMSSFSISVSFDQNGNATGVIYNGKTYSIQDWNKQFEGLDPQNGNTSTHKN